MGWSTKVMRSVRETLRAHVKEARERIFGSIFSGDIFDIHNKYGYVLCCAGRVRERVRWHLTVAFCVAVMALDVHWRAYLIIQNELNGSWGGRRMSVTQDIYFSHKRRSFAPWAQIRTMMNNNSFVMFSYSFVRLRCVFAGCAIVL